MPLLADLLADLGDVLEWAKSHRAQTAIAAGMAALLWWARSRRQTPGRPGTACVSTAAHTLLAMAASKALHKVHTHALPNGDVLLAGAPKAGDAWRTTAVHPTVLRALLSAMPSAVRECAWTASQMPASVQHTLWGAGGSSSGNCGPSTSALLLKMALGYALFLWVLYRISRPRPADVGTSLESSSASVTFAAVAGLAEAKQALREVLAFFHPEAAARYEALGARAPRGVLLQGLPGNGKTLLARAVAGEAGVPFFAAAASDFVDTYVGVGASRVRALFERAAASPTGAVVFIDEIDAVGGARSMPGMRGGGNQERESTLNQLLVCMDGLGSRRAAEPSTPSAQADSNESTALDGSTGQAGTVLGWARAAWRSMLGEERKLPLGPILVIAATNRAELLDPALVRPGRFDRVIHVPAPDCAARAGILAHYMRRLTCVPHSEHGAWQAWCEIGAHTAEGYSAAQLEAAVNEAAFMAARAQRSAVRFEDFQLALAEQARAPEPHMEVLT